ncbi:hypothetical protein AB0D22_29595 [Kitasatospora sp. NPDC048538]|uniref:hypothetical protein n=1 Tax=Kitasatospora sp. NPDC048538 TaxID=3155633 RepID=UPI0033D8E553
MPAPPSLPRSRTAAADVRLVRAVVLASVSVALAAAAHTAAGGRVEPGPLLLGWLVTALAGAAGSGRRRSLPTITGAFSVGQLGLHLWLQAAPEAPLPDRTRRVAAPGGHVHVHHPAAVTGGGAAHTAAHSGMLGHSPAMLAAHAGAALATGWLLHRVEVLLWRLMDLARALPESARGWRRRFSDTVARLAGRAAPVRPRTAPRAAPVGRADEVLPRPAVLRHSLVLRGPPRTVGV